MLPVFQGFKKIHIEWEFIQGSNLVLRQWFLLSTWVLNDHGSLAISWEFSVWIESESGRITHGNYPEYFFRATLFSPCENHCAGECPTLVLCCHYGGKNKINLLYVMFLFALWQSPVWIAVFETWYLIYLIRIFFPTWDRNWDSFTFY